jgi:hypothetical protein
MYLADNGVGRIETQTRGSGKDSDIADALEILVWAQRGTPNAPAGRCRPYGIPPRRAWVWSSR